MFNSCAILLNYTPSSTSYTVEVYQETVELVTMIIF